MLRRLRFKASLPALFPFPGRRRSVSEVPSNFPFANGGEALKSRCNGGFNKSIVSSSERTSNMEQPGKLPTSMASSNQALAFPRHEVDVVGNLNHSQPESVGDDDDFAELGPSALDGTDSGFNSAKEERKDTYPPGILLENGSQQSRGTSQRQDSYESFTRIPLRQDKRDPGIPVNLEGINGVLRTKTARQIKIADNNQSPANMQFITVNNVPRSISVQDLREAVSTFGEIQNSHMRPGKGGVYGYYVKFKSMESRERALAAQWITVKNSRLPVQGLPTLEHVTVRITNVSMETTEPAIHLMCMSYGYVTGLGRTKEGAVDVVFRVKDRFISESIVKHLNDVVIDDCRWSAQLLPKVSHNWRANASGSQWPIGSEISNLLEGFRKQFQMQRIYLEDLENLHHAVLHLRDRPPDNQHSSAC